MRTIGPRGWVAVSSLATALVVTATCNANAQVRYAPYPGYVPDTETIYPFGVPYDDTESTGLSFEIVPYAPAAADVRIVPRCTYPNGWNVTDFSRDVNGLPSGLDHVCPQAVPTRRARARY